MKCEAPTYYVRVHILRYFKRKGFCMTKTRRNAGIFLVLSLFLTSFSGLNAAGTTDQIILPFKRFGLEWSTELPDQVELLRIWFTLDNGHTWEVYSEANDPSSPAPVKVSEDATYGFYTQARDISTLEEPAPVPGTPPKIFVVVDTKKPTLVLVSPNSSEVYSNTQDLRIEWNASDVNFGPTPISLYYSKDGGGTWHTLKKDLPNSGTYIWKIPAESSQYYKVKIVAVDLAGNESEDISDSNFSVDGLAPATMVKGPREAKSPVFDLHYNARDLGGAGIAKIQVFFQMDSNKEWHLYGEDKDLKSPFSFEARKGGRYGFKLVATDNVGNSEPMPDNSTQPDIWCLMDSISPSVQLTNFKGRIHPAGGGKRREITWIAKDENIANGPITIELSLDDGATWNSVIATDFKNSGVFPWQVPTNVNVKRARIKVTALDVLGNRGYDISDPFAIDGKAPKTKVRVVTWNEDSQSHDNTKIHKSMKMASSGTMVKPQKSSAEYVTMAFEALKNNDLPQAERYGNKALNLDANNYLGHALFGRLYFKKEMFKKALSSYKRSIELNENYQPSRIGLGVCYFTLGQASLAKDRNKTREYFKKAALEYEAAVQILPDNWDEYFNLGYIYARLQRYDDAISYLKKATELSEDNGDAFWFLGQVYEKLSASEDSPKHLEKSVQYYKAAVKAYPAGSTSMQKAEYKVKALTK